MRPCGETEERTEHEDVAGEGSRDTCCPGVADWGYLAVSRQDPIVLDPNRGGLVEKRRRDGRVSDGAASIEGISARFFRAPTRPPGRG